MVVRPETPSKSIEVGHVMPREVQRERGEQRENNPGETGHRQRLTAIEASGFDAQKTQTAARDHGDADCREVARRLPFLKDQRRRQGKGHERGEEQQERSQVVPDNAQVVGVNRCHIVLAPNRARCA